MAKTRKDSLAIVVVRVSGGWVVRGSGPKARRHVYKTKSAAERNAKRKATEKAHMLPSLARNAEHGRFTVGRSAFAKISAVEGLYLSSDMKRDFRYFDQKGLTGEKRRRAIISKYGGKAP
jgi:hypothetical protein